jgi:HTTM domain/Vitamin K-dependent gamma-carboxylase, lumenal domain
MSVTTIDEDRDGGGPESEGPASEGPASEGPASEGPASEGPGSEDPGSEGRGRRGRELMGRLFEPIDAAGLVVFRIVFGLLMAWDAARYVFLGWVKSQYIEPALTLKFVGFFWVDVLPAPAMFAVFGVMFAAGIAIAFGAYYRLSCALYFLCHTYVFLVAAEYYLNHAYLISTIAFLMIFVPAHGAMSVDARRAPEPRHETAPRWAYGLLMAMMALVYIYGSIAKMNPDWLSGEPIRHWLAGRAETAPDLVARFLRSEVAVLGVSWTGVLFDLLVAPMLFWRRTRLFAVLLSLSFHLANRYLFHIGVFPWFSLLMTTLFFEPDWPRRLPLGFGETVEEFLEALGDHDVAHRDTVPEPPSRAYQQRATAALGVLIAVHVLMPLRHHLFPGNVAWNEEGHMLSWRMKLRNKHGRFSLRVVDKASGKEWEVDPSSQLHDRQYRKAATRPDIMISYVHYLRDAYRRDMGMDVAIYADAWVALNYRADQRFIDPKTDLASVEISIFKHNPWVTEFTNTPLPSPVPRLRTILGRSAMLIHAAARRSERLRR